MPLSQLLDNFEALAAAPNGVAKLREMILQLAVQGKLVAQNPNDEPASELLKRIETERERLVAAGTLRKSRAKVPATAGAPLHDLPDGWQWVPTGSVVFLTRGITFPAGAKSRIREPGTVACLRTANVQEETTWDDLIYVSADYVKHPSQWVRPSDILISLANSYELVGKVSLVKDVPERSTFGGFIGAIRTALVDHGFLLTGLRSPYVQRLFRASSSQTTNIANISLRGMNPIPFPLPPLAEQKRIVAKVDELMGLCDRLEEEQQKQGELRTDTIKACLHALTTAPREPEVEAEAEKPAGDDVSSLPLFAHAAPKPDTRHLTPSPWSRIQDHFGILFDTPESVTELRNAILQLAVQGRLAPQDPNDEPASALLERMAVEKTRGDKTEGGRKPKATPVVEPGDPPFRIPIGWRWTTIGAVSWFVTSGSRGWKQYYADSGGLFIRSQDIKTDALLPEEPAYVQIPEGTEGTRTLVEVGDLVITITGANVGKAARIITLPGPAYVSQHVALIRLTDAEIAPYSHLWLIGEHGGRHHLLSQHYGDKPGLNLNNVRGLPVPLPPLAEQKRIVAKVAALMRSCDRLEDSLRRSQDTAERFAEAIAASVNQPARA